MLAASATWQTLCGVADADEAAQPIAIYYGEEIDLPFPRAIVNDTSEGGSKVRRRVGLATWGMDGTVNITFEIEIPVSAGATNLEEEGNWFTSQLGAIVKELEDISAAKTLVSGKYPLEITQTAPLEGPFRLAAEERETPVPEAGVSSRPLWIETVELMFLS